ncbi:MAG: hypothetical protein PHW13_04925 [Methylococcales bacterium]|nr:hypothetical protein [Methylococcales bacterium]
MTVNKYPTHYTLIACCFINAQPMVETAKYRLPQDGQYFSPGNWIAGTLAIFY